MKLFEAVSFQDSDFSGILDQPINMAEVNYVVKARWDLHTPTLPHTNLASVSNKEGEEKPCPGGQTSQDSSILQPSRH